MRNIRDETPLRAADALQTSAATTLGVGEDSSNGPAAKSDFGQKRLGLLK